MNFTVIAIKIINCKELNEKNNYYDEKLLGTKLFVSIHFNWNFDGK
ncbi:hypothetical protein [Solitalea lacus]|nr:hypothetical protein [Solitalea lacus]UKJ07886.1 hypothetical protein L2B55_01665 [Solitalea lacus]